MTSAGILLYRRGARGIEVLLAHPGGPFWANRDEGAWSIPKGEVDEGEDLLEVALREFEEEVGIGVARVDPMPLGSVVQRSGKIVVAWAGEGDLDPADQSSNTFSMEWPPGSGQIEEFPEIDRVEWFAPSAARRKLNPAQVAFVDRLLEACGDR